MSIPYFNQEHYADPTVYEALKNIEAERKALRAFRPIVYICSPFAGDVEGNIKNAKRYCRFAVDSGYIPIAVHLLFPQFMDEEMERELALQMDLVLLEKCDELWVFGKTMTSGMRAEIAYAKNKKMKIRYFVDAGRN